MLQNGPQALKKKKEEKGEKRLNNFTPCASCQLGPETASNYVEAITAKPICFRSLYSRNLSYTPERSFLAGDTLLRAVVSFPAQDALSQVW